MYIEIANATDIFGDCSCQAVIEEPPKEWKSQKLIVRARKDTNNEVFAIAKNNDYQHKIILSLMESVHSVGRVFKGQR